MKILILILSILFLSTCSQKPKQNYLPSNEQEQEVVYATPLYDTSSLKQESPFPSLTPQMKLVVGDTIDIGGFPSSVSVTLSNQMKAQLTQIAIFLKENPSLVVRLNGHSDNTGTREENRTISRNRAVGVRNYLMSQGIQGGRIYFDGLGDLYPKASNDTEAGRRTNRRVTIVILNQGTR
jgi:outer membrane protein OmpA-like peptidoglycan-associated protein